MTLNVTPPSVTGDPTVGSVLTVDTGSFVGARPQTYEVEWYRVVVKDGSGATSIATSASATGVNPNPTASGDAPLTVAASATGKVTRNSGGAATVSTSAIGIASASSTLGGALSLWDGTEWAPHTLTYWEDSQWKSGVTQYWDGTQWVAAGGGTKTALNAIAAGSLAVSATGTGARVHHGSASITIAPTAVATGAKYRQSLSSSLKVSAAAAGERLAQAVLPPPPEGWETFTTVDVSSADAFGSIFLRNDTNYKIIDQGHTGRGVRLRGGRKVYARGVCMNITRAAVPTWHEDGELITTGFELDEYPTTGEYAEGGSKYSGPPQADREFFIEGCWFTGDALTQGITMKCPTAKVTLVYNRVEKVQFSDCDHRDGTNTKSKNHPDLVQPYGGCKSLSIYKFTGRSGYQGLFLRNESGQAMHFYLRDVNVEAVPIDGTDSVTYYGGAMVWPFETTDTYDFGPGVWAKHHPNGLYKDNTFIGRRSRYYDTTNAVYVVEAPPADAVFKDALRYRNGEQTLTFGSDGLGSYAQFTNSGVTGKVYSGAPPDGDFVPTGKAGVGYTRDGMTASTDPETTTVAADASLGGLTAVATATVSTASTTYLDEPFTGTNGDDWSATVWEAAGPSLTCSIDTNTGKAFQAQSTTYVQTNRAIKPDFLTVDDYTLEFDWRADTLTDAQAGFRFRSDDSSSQQYEIRISINSTSSKMRLFKKTSAGNNEVAAYTQSGVAFVAGTTYRCQVLCNGGTIRVRHWIASDPASTTDKIKWTDPETQGPILTGSTQRRVKVTVAVNANGGDTTIFYDNVKLLQATPL